MAEIDLGGGLAVCVILVAVVLTSIRVLEVRGVSMTPGISEGESVLVLKPRARLSRGSIIVLHSPLSPPLLVLRRIIALPGDLVEVRNRRVFVNDAEIEETYVSAQQNLRQQDIASVRVPDHSYFVMADNRDAGFDSRHWGVIADQQIYGKVLMSH